jgi:Flp pilus assembly protein CpaB
MGRMRGFLWLVAGLLVAALAALIAFTALSRATAQRSGQAVTGPQVQVVVAARAIPVRSALTAEDLQVKAVQVDAAPEGAIREAEVAIGKLTLVDLYPGEIILSQRLVDPNVTSGDGKQALIVSGEDVLMALPASDLMSRTGILKPGDHVDLLFTLEVPVTGAAATGGGATEGGGGGGAPEQKPATFNLLQNATIAAIVAEPSAAEAGTAKAGAILFTVSPQDALVLKHVKDAGAILDVVVRAPGNENPSNAEPVDLDYIINRYQIPTGGGR